MSALGQPMELHYAAPFPIIGVRLRASARVVYDCDELTLRIGVRGVPCLLEVDFVLDVTNPLDPFWSATITSEQAELAPSQIYEYVFLDETGRVLLYGPCSVVDHPRAV